MIKYKTFLRETEEKFEQLNKQSKKVIGIILLFVYVSIVTILLFV